ncbi:hypothetical protein [Tautonia plasticadhaerens]|uniref:Uncharacterized protein n=1 Tax=Tautonia plasticadhaerens TaxID=2527974 RepID=A0A518H2B5_9BACT|nr:hypothetical protein [Tautonia plasticadhaerens]QDV34996.1 hypothetical protein ElP_28930 [Tautonia plasticadhaerens]
MRRMIRCLTNNWHICFSVLAASCGLGFVWVVQPTDWMKSVQAKAEPAWHSASGLLSGRTARVDDALAQAERESAAALEARIRDLEGYLESRKSGGKAFAEDILSLQAKARYAGIVVEEVIGEFASLFDTGPKEYQIPRDPIGEDVDAAFDRHVLSEDELSEAIQVAAAGYIDDLRSIEARARVAARAPAEQITGGISAEDLPSGSYDRYSAVTATARIAEFDFVLSPVLFVAGNKLGDLAASPIDSAIAGQRWTPGQKRAASIGANIGSDYAVGKGIDAALHGAGYTPEQDIERSVHAALDAIRASVIDGDAAGGESGLRGRLRKLHDERVRWRAEAFARLAR